MAIFTIVVALIFVGLLYGGLYAVFLREEKKKDED